MAALEEAQPLQSTLAVFNTSQVISKTELKVDGIAGVVSAGLFSFGRGRALMTVELAKLLGIKFERLILGGVAEKHFCHALRQSVPPPVLGIVLIGLLASLGDHEARLRSDADEEDDNT